jgi:hypothetical protein
LAQDVVEPDLPSSIGNHTLENHSWANVDTSNVWMMLHKKWGVSVGFRPTCFTWSSWCRSDGRRLNLQSLRHPVARKNGIQANNQLTWTSRSPLCGCSSLHKRCSRCGTPLAPCIGAKWRPASVLGRARIVCNLYPQASAASTDYTQAGKSSINL